MEIKPIGYVRTCFGEKFAIPRQPNLCPSAWARLEFLPEYRSASAVRGLDGFSHIWLIFGFHLTTQAGWNPTVRPPRLGGNQRVGVFASRSTFRPNNLGLSLVKLDAISMVASDGMEAPVLYLSGVDLVDGSPIYDVKPYLAYAESIPEAKTGYAKEALTRLEVKIDETAHVEFSTLDERSQRVIREALSLDPRPATSNQCDIRQYGVFICGKNIKFCISGQICRIIAVEAG